MEEQRLHFEDPEPVWCSAPIALGVGRGSQRRVLYAPREYLILHSPVFKTMLAEGNGYRESEPGVVIELPEDDPKEFDDLLWLIFYGIGVVCDSGLRLASKYLMEDVIRFFDRCASDDLNDDGSDELNHLSRLLFFIQWIDGASLPRTKALVFREICTRWRLDELRNDGVWNAISETLRLELMEHCYDDHCPSARKSARLPKARETFNPTKNMWIRLGPSHAPESLKNVPTWKYERGKSCSTYVPEIQWPDLLTFESPAAEHCGGVASLRLVVGRGDEKRMLHCSRELIFALFPALRERLRNGGDSLELEDDSADDFIHYMNWKLLKSPWEAFSAHQQSAILCLGSKYQADNNFHYKIDFSRSFTLCHKLYLAEQCRLDDLQRKYVDEIREDTVKLDEARRSEWWPQLSEQLRLSLPNHFIDRNSPSGSDSSSIL